MGLWQCLLRGRLFLLWLRSGKLWGGPAASNGQRETVAQVKQSSEAIIGRGHLFLPLPEIWGCLHKTAALGMKGSSNPERLFSWVYCLRRNLIIKHSSCILSACSVHFPGLFGSLWCLGFQCSLSSCFIPFTCSRAEADQSNSTGPHLIPVP